MGTIYIAYPSTAAPLSGIVIVAPGTLLDGEWQTDALPIVGAAPGTLLDGEWQTDVLPIVIVAP
jgi:hypothetical protein